MKNWFGNRREGIKSKNPLAIQKTLKAINITGAIKNPSGVLDREYTQGMPNWRKPKGLGSQLQREAEKYPL